MNLRLIAIGMLAAFAGVLGAVTFIPGAIDGLLPQRAKVTTGKALVGGPFQLTTHNGDRARDSDFRNKLMIVDFGFTYCPDICPAALQLITAALDKIGDKADQIAPLFITVDPERDTPEQLKLYMSSFHKNLIGLTGSAKEISQVAKAYRVYYRKVKSETLNDYTMDHSSLIYLMDGNGQFITYFPHTTSPDRMAEKLAAEVAKLKR
jgi:cytochrome oxidase Cu insertion factor (SCO1/SenC/PrrC family)